MCSLRFLETNEKCYEQKMSGVQMWAERVRTSVSGGGAVRWWGGGSGSTDLLFLSTVKRCRTLCGPFHDDSSGEIPIIYGYFVPNPEKYCPVKGICLLYA